MSTLVSCDSCHGFVPATADRCPCCDAPASPPARWRRLGRALLAAAGGGVMAMTLMACYGAPAHYPTVPPQGCPAGGADVDGDGACTPTDCDDNNAAVHPGAEDVDGDSIDQNCDGVDGVKPAETATDPGDSTVPADDDDPATSPE